MKRLCASGCSRPEHPDVESGYIRV